MREQHGFDVIRSETNRGKLQFAQISLQQLLQLARPDHNNGVSCDAQKLLIAKFCQGARQRFARRSHLGGEHALGPVEFNFNLRRADGPWALFEQPIGQIAFPYLSKSDRRAIPRSRGDAGSSTRACATRDQVGFATDRQNHFLVLAEQSWALSRAHPQDSRLRLRASLRQTIRWAKQMDHLLFPRRIDAMHVNRALLRNVEAFASIPFAKKILALVEMFLDNE